MGKPTKKLMILTIVYCVALLAFWFYQAGGEHQLQQVFAENKSTAVAAQRISHQQVAAKKNSKTKKASAKQHAQLVENVPTKSATPTKQDWRAPSESKPYPTLQASDWLKVSLTKQRTYLMRGEQVLYTMRCSTGSGGDRATPAGSYTIQPERGERFFNQASGEGANYWVSWKDHGVYLFHSVPIDRAGNYIASEAEELGQRANSHGCIRLSVADAKWLYSNVLTGMRVEIA